MIQSHCWAHLWITWQCFLLSPSGIFAILLTFLSTPDCPGQTRTLHTPFLAPSWRQAYMHSVALSSPSRGSIQLQGTRCLGRSSGLRYLLILTFVLCSWSSRLVFFTPAHLLHFGQDFLEVLSFSKFRFLVFRFCISCQSFIMIVFGRPRSLLNVSTYSRKVLHSLCSASKVLCCAAFSSMRHIA